MQALKQKLVEVESALHQSEIDLLISRKLEAAASRARDAGVELVSVDTQTAEPESSKSPLVSDDDTLR